MKITYKAITNRLYTNDLIDKYMSRIQLNIPKELCKDGYDMPLAAWCYVISDQELSNLLDEVVKFTFDETFKMIKRNLEDDRDD